MVSSTVYYKGYKDGKLDKGNSVWVSVWCWQRYFAWGKWEVWLSG